MTNSCCMNCIFSSCSRFSCFRKIFAPWQRNVITLSYNGFPYIFISPRNVLSLLCVARGGTLSENLDLKTVHLLPSSMPPHERPFSLSLVYFSINRCNSSCFLMLSFRLSETKRVKHLMECKNMYAGVTK